MPTSSHIPPRKRRLRSLPKVQGRPRELLVLGKWLALFEGSTEKQERVGTGGYLVEHLADHRQHAARFQAPDVPVVGAHLSSSTTTGTGHPFATTSNPAAVGQRDSQRGPRLPSLDRRSKP